MVSRKAHVMPGGMTRASAKAGIVVMVLFLLFGLLFGGVVLSEMSASELGLLIAVGGFFVVWVLVCTILIIHFRRLLSRTRTDEVLSLVDVDIVETDDKDATSPPDFDTRLRKLEQLRKEGLITDAEYEKKRGEIMGDRW